MSRRELVDIGVDPDSIPDCVSLLPTETTHLVATRAVDGSNA
jgi:hypothetical protein